MEHASATRYAESYFGAWACEPSRLQAMAAAVRAASPSQLTRPTDRRRYEVLDGVAVIELNGPLTKHRTSFEDVVGGTSTVETRALVRDAVRDPGVRSILLRVDSPGGTVAGTSDLAAAVAEANTRKPVYAFVEDLAGSAAYWIASQARHLTANAPAEVGSIGTFAVLEDSSGQYEREGVKVHVVSTGPLKGAGVRGAPITGEQLEALRVRITDINNLFVAAVARGRRMSEGAVRKVADGRLFVGRRAVEAGLVDEVGTFESAVDLAAGRRASKPRTLTRAMLADTMRVEADATGDPKATPEQRYSAFVFGTERGRELYKAFRVAPLVADDDPPPAA
jgi:signal peptide peptidase SppA